VAAAVIVEPRITLAQAVLSRGPLAQAWSTERPAGGGQQAIKKTNDSQKSCGG